MQRYFAYAKAARARFPEIKLTGPVPANEWQWFNWVGGINAEGRSWPWLEFFIKRIADEQARTGIRLLDVLDIHHYPGVTNPADVVQIHRTYFDTTYDSPEANGVKAVNGGTVEFEGGGLNFNADAAPGRGPRWPCARSAFSSRPTSRKGWTTPFRVGLSKACMWAPTRATWFRWPPPSASRCASKTSCRSACPRWKARWTSTCGSHGRRRARACWPTDSFHSGRLGRRAGRPRGGS